MTLAELLGQQPELIGADDAATAANVNALIQSVATHLFINKRTVYATIGFAAGLQLVGMLEGMREQAGAVGLQAREILNLLDVARGGVDISLDDSRAIVDSLTGDYLSAENAAKIKALGFEDVPWTRIHLGLPYVTEHDIAAARGQN